MTSIASSFPPPEATTVLSEVQHDLLSPTRPRARTFEAELQDGEMSEIELKAEMETLLSLRRRSISQPASLDPDLPNVILSPTSPPHSQPGRPSLSVTTSSPDSINVAVPPKSPTAALPAETGILQRRISSSLTSKLPSDHPIPNLNSPLPSPPLSSPYSPPIDGTTAAHSSQDLFWLPASLHPELAPQEFKAFIREQTRPANLARRVSSGGEGVSSGFGSGRIDRKKSMLRGEYIPGKGDGVGETGKDVATGRKAISGGGRAMGRFNFDELTIKDLQRLEVLAARAEAEVDTAGEGEGEILGRVLRRSLSLNPNHVAAAAAEGANFPPTFAHDSFSPSQDDAPLSPDSPLIVPPPGQILRRSARTKIRKAGLIGDGNGHRFGPSRRVRSVSGTESIEVDAVGTETTGESDRDSAGDVSLEGMDSLSVDGHTTATVGVENEAELVNTRLSSGSDESQELIIHIETVESAELPLLEPLSPVLIDFPPIPSAAIDEEITLSSTLESSTPPKNLILPPTASTSTSSIPVIDYVPVVPVTPIPVPIRPQLTPIPIIKVKEAKEKKSGWARLGLSSRNVNDEDPKKKGKGKETEKLEEGYKRSQPNSAPVEFSSERRTSNSSEKESSFFGGLFSKKRSENESIQTSPAASPPMPSQAHLHPVPQLPTASGMLGPNGRYTNFYRLPIHVERAVYRLSHIKLANPRRPLYEQVLISNLMFWYLSIINKPSVIPPPQNNPPRERQQSQTNNGGNDRITEEKKEKRPGLSKGVGMGGRQPGRSAEQPIKQPNYDVQTQRIDQEYSPNQFSQPLSSKGSNSNQPHLNSQPHLNNQQHVNNQQYNSDSRDQTQQLHSRSNSAPTQSHDAPARSPDRTSAPADYYRSTSPNNQRAPSHQPNPITHRENSGFLVKSRSYGNSVERGRSKSSEGNEIQSVSRENGRALQQQNGGDTGYDELLDAYSDSALNN